MARADLILNLVRAGTRGDHAQFQKTVEALAADEEAKQHKIFADRILAQLRNGGNGRGTALGLPQIRGAASPLVAELVPTRRIEDLVLPREVERAVRELVEEQHRADLLRSHNLEPRNRILLAGPPGNGKTALAEGIAEALNVPMLVVRYEAVIGSYLGETTQRIGQVFEHARGRQCVLFFDEFDVVGKERGDIHETGEIKRVVSSLLLQVDALPNYVVVVTASNHPELLDRAVWRRFQIRLELPMPEQGQIEEWFRRFEKRTGHVLGLSHHCLAETLKGLSFAEIEDFGTDVLRRLTLNQPEGDSRKIASQCLEQWKKRFMVS
jgi:SpoVK/Ycf46/Vps4 family AAA+-type ATPase